MNYLNRPVYIWTIDWAEVIDRSINYDLRETSLGFGKEFFLPTATYTAQGWSWMEHFKTNADIEAIELFTTSLFGRLNGFWLPVPFEAMRIAGAVAANQFDVFSSGLTATWLTRPDIHLWIALGDNSNPQLVQISAVADNGNGTERVTLAANLNPAPAPGMIVRRLHYVRLINDEEKGQFIAEGWLQRAFEVLELPLEYTNMEIGRQPIYLYHLWAAAPVLQDWYYTSFAAPVWSSGNQYQPFPMSHKAIKQTSKAANDDVQVEAQSDPNHPFGLFFPFPLGSQLNVEIRQATFAAPDNATLLFAGIVRSVDDQGIKLVATCSSRLFYLERKAPRMLFQPNCNYQLFDRNCAIIRAQFETSVIISAISNAGTNPTVTCTLAWPTLNPERPHTANWFAGGIFETGYGTSFEPRSILASTWDAVNNLLTLTLNLPLRKAQVGNWCQITAGCDGLAATCTNKFNNFPRFGGFVAIPQRNLTLEAFNNLPVSQGGKK